MEYILIVWQREEGCDYMIGCGVRVEEFSAVDDVIAEEKAMHIMRGMVHRECHIGRVVLLPADRARNLDVIAINARADKNETDDAERAEYERLKAKFGE